MSYLKSSEATKSTMSKTASVAKDTPCAGHSSLIDQDTEDKEFIEEVKDSFSEFRHKLYESTMFKQRGSCPRINSLLRDISYLGCETNRNIEICIFEDGDVV